MMNFNKLTMIALIVCGIQSTVFAQQKTFNGKWKIVAEQSDFGGLEQKNAAPTEIDVNIISDSIVVNRYFGKEQSFKESLLFGVNALETLSPDGNTLRKSKVNWSVDRKRLSFDWYYEVSGNEWQYTRHETWSISEDGKNLTVDRVTILSEKTDKVKAVYQKQ